MELKKVVRTSAVIQSVRIPTKTDMIAAKDHEEAMRAVAQWVYNVGGSVLDFQVEEIVVQGVNDFNRATYAHPGDWLLYNESNGKFTITSDTDIQNFFVEVKDA